MLRAGLALVLALEQGAVAALVAPLLRASSAVMSRTTLSPSTRSIGGAHQRMMDAAAVGIALGQDQAVAGDAVDGADMLAVAADDFHMLADLAEQLALAPAVCSRQLVKSSSKRDRFSRA